MGEFERLLFFLIAAVFIACKECQGAEGNACGDNQKWPCDNSECILRGSWCDRAEDCEDGSDEKYCKQQGWWGAVPDNNCNEKHFVCADGRCIPAVGRCDGFEDCSDYSDENDCEKTPSGSSGSSVTQEPAEYDGAAIDEPLPRSSSTTTMRSTTTTTTTTTTTMRSSTSTTTVRSTTSAAPALRRSTTTTPAPDYYRNRKVDESRNPNPQIFANQYDRSEYGSHNYPNRYEQTQNGQRNYRNHVDHAGNGQRSYTTGTRDQTHNNQRTPSRDPQRNTGHDTGPSQFFPGYQYSSTTPHYPESYTRPSTGSVYGSFGPIRNSYVPRQRLMTPSPRRVLYPPNLRQLSYSHKKAQRAKLPHFYFANNYTHQIAYNYERNVEKAKQWFIDQRDSSYSWGQDTPRALVALSLITNSFTSDVADNDLMTKGLQAHLGVKLLRNRTEVLSVPSLAMYINALHATCQNPRDFLGHDLVKILYDRRYDRDRGMNPYVFLTLCLSNVVLRWEDVENLKTLLNSRNEDGTQNNDEMAKDQRSLAITALGCVLQQYNEASNERYELSRKVSEGINILLSQQQNGMFGNIYSTAIAAQGLMSTNLTNWDPKPTLDSLARNQKNDGSFGDMLSTYYSLPALSGRSLVHLRNIQCDPIATVNKTLSPSDILNLPGPRKSVFLTIKVGYPETVSFSMQLSVPEDTNLLDTMRVAEHLDPRFGFKYKTFNNAVDVYEVTKIPNDPERGLYWNIYVLKPGDRSMDLRGRYTGNIKTLIPSHSQEIVYWYLPTV